MRFLFALLLTLTSQLGFAAQMSVSSDCTDYAASKYLVRGSWESELGGERLWDFPKLTQTFNSSSSARCDKEAFAQALTDSNEYWSEIKEKYKCPGSGARQCEASETNLSYLQVCATTYSNELKNVHDNLAACDYEGHGTDGIDKTKKWARDHVAVISHVNKGRPDICESVPKKYLKNPKLRDVVDFNKGFSTCIIASLQGILKGAKSFFSDIWEVSQLAGKLAYKFGSKMGSFLKAAYYGTIPQFVAETMQDGSNFLNDLAKGLLGIPNQILSMAKKEVAGFGCLNYQGQVDYVCKGVGNIGTQVVLDYLTGKALVSAVFKKVVKPLDKVLDLKKKAPEATFDSARALPGKKPQKLLAESTQKLDSVIKGKVPSEHLPDTVTIGRMKPEEAKEALEKFLDGDSIRNTQKRLHPDRYNADPSIGPRLKKQIADEFAIFQDLVDRSRGR